ncbi:glutamate:gamma-aminobutyrate antiporter [Escherichia coli]
MATSVQTGKAKQLTLLGFFAITASMVMAVYEYPTFATSGFSLVFFLLLGGILWFIPVGLCAAEMATVDGWEEGGVFAWVSNTLGPRWGFAAIPLAICKSPLVLFRCSISCLGALSYILKWPALNEDPITKTIAALIILWALALTQFGGTKYTARIAKVGFFAGILLPAFILIALAAIYLHSGAPVAIEMDSKTFFPDFSKVGTLVVFVAFILSYMGVEASATHVNEMSNPGRHYPLAMLLLMVAAICLSSVGGLSIAMVIPGNEINLSAGVMQTFTVLMSHVAPEIEWTVRVISALLLLGVLAEIASWIRLVLLAGCMSQRRKPVPAAFAKMNKNGVPVTLVISQLVITSIASIILTNTGGGNNMSFLIALALTVVIYLRCLFHAVYWLHCVGS